jgi:integrase/recombinase XerC
MLNLEGFLDHYRDVKGASPDTVKAYHADLKSFGRFLEQQAVTRIVDVDHKVITGYINHMRGCGVGRKGKVGLADSTIQRRLAAVSSYCDYVRATTHHKFQNPMREFKLKWKRNNLPKPVEHSVLEQVLSRIESLRDLTLFTLFHNSGLRVSEMARLDRTSIIIEQVTDDQGVVSYQGSAEALGKGSKSRPFFLSLSGVTALAKYLETRTDDLPPLFISERRKRMSVRAMQERLAHWAKVAAAPHFSPHRLRHTYATDLINAGIDVMHLKELLGHNSVATTLNYAKISDATLARGYHAAMEFVGPSKG